MVYAPIQLMLLALDLYLKLQRGLRVEVVAVGEVEQEVDDPEEWVGGPALGVEGLEAGECPLLLGANHLNCGWT